MSVKRRDFLKIMGVLGASSVITSGCGGKDQEITSTLVPSEISPTSTTPTEVLANTPTEIPTMPPTPIPEGVITEEMVAAAEKIIGIELSDEERQDVLEGLQENLEIIEVMRGLSIEDTVPPCMVFNPIPAGMQFSRIVEPPEFSAVSVEAPEDLEDAAFYSVLELAELLRTGQITSTALTEMYIGRLKRLDPTLKFVVNLTEELALEQAARADEEISAGNYRGLLHGIPYGIKDLFSVRGYPTTWGTRVFENRIFDYDASVVERLEEAGAVLLAKLSTGALASGHHWFGGETKNPWRPTDGSGGSSAGPASATAAGCVAFSIGTESNGSMTGPCDECGVSGLRPTFGRVSRHGVMTTSWSFDKVTPMCRSAEDCAVVFDAIFGQDDFDNTIIDLPFNWKADFDIQNLRIGYRTKYFQGELMPGVTTYRKKERAESEKVLAFFRELGVNLVPMNFELEVLTSQTGIGMTMMCENAASAEGMFQSGLLNEFENQHWPDYWRRYHFVPAVDYLQATRSRSTAIRQMKEIMQDIDVYIEITSTSTWLTNVTGHPVVVIPCGFVDGKPISISFVGKLFGEAETLAVAKAFQDGTRYHKSHPSL